MVGPIDTESRHIFLKIKGYKVRDGIPNINTYSASYTETCREKSHEEKRTVLRGRERGGEREDRSGKREIGREERKAWGVSGVEGDTR